MDRLPYKGYTTEDWREILRQLGGIITDDKGRLVPGPATCYCVSVSANPRLPVVIPETSYFETILLRAAAGIILQIVVESAINMSHSAIRRNQTSKGN